MPEEVETGNGGLEVDTKIRSALDAPDATYELRIQEREARYVSLIARAGDDEIKINGAQLTLAILEFQLDALARGTGSD
jgi:hypothetical protein